MNRTLSRHRRLATPSRAPRTCNSHGGMNSQSAPARLISAPFRDTIANLAKDLLHRVINLASPDVRTMAVRDDSCIRA